MLLLSSLVIDTTTPLTPDHGGDVVGVALIAGLTAGIGATGAVLVFRLHPTSHALLSAMGIGLAAAVLIFLNTMSYGEMLASHADFASGPVVRWRGTLQLDIAHTAHDKGTSYWVHLARYDVEMRVSPSDYAAAFGKADKAPADGWCLRAELERDGAALRIMHGSTTMPDASLVRCPSSTSVSA